MAAIIHNPDTLWQSLSLEFQLIKAGYISDISKYGYKSVNSNETNRYKEELYLRTSNIDTSIFHPVFLRFKTLIEPDSYIDSTDWDTSIINPAAIGFTFLEDTAEISNDSPPEIENKSSTEYLNEYIFPTLIPALEKMLQIAETKNCFTRKRTAFDPLDFLVEYLYQNNPQADDSKRNSMTLGDIPFVAKHWIRHPRPPLPKSLIWTNAEAALVLQSFWRGYLVRKDPEIQELRQWQKDWRERNKDIREKVKKFWEERDEASSLLSSQRSMENYGDIDDNTR